MGLFIPLFGHDSNTTVRLFFDAVRSMTTQSQKNDRTTPQNLLSEKKIGENLMKFSA